LNRLPGNDLSITCRDCHPKDWFLRHSVLYTVPRCRPFPEAVVGWWAIN
jgi:hypothetical protein